MKIIKVSTELEMSVHEFPSGTIREHNKALCELIGNGCNLVEHVMPKRLYTELKMPSARPEAVSYPQYRNIVVGFAKGRNGIMERTARAVTG